MKERPTFDFTDAYAQFSGLELTEQQLQELGERQARILATNIPPQPKTVDIKEQEKTD